MNQQPEKVGTHHSDRWGIPFKINDEATAKYAVMLSGLPVFLLGLTYGIIGLFVVSGLMGVNEQTPDHMRWLLWAYFPLGLLLVACGLKIRKQSSWLVPLAGLVYLIWTGVTLAYTIHWVQWLVPIPWVILSINGLRGWLWLRRNRAAD